MSLDAIVWLVAGAGLGIGATLLLLVVYTGLERWRLSCRFRRARLLRQVAEPAAPAPVLAPAPAPVARAEPMGRPKHPPAVAAEAGDPAAPIPKVAATPEAPVPSPTEDLVVAVPEPVAETARPTLSVVKSDPELAKPAVAPQPAPREEVAARVVKPVKAGAAPRVEPAEKRSPQSVEEMFAEAFALDKVSVAPLPGDTDGSRS